MLGRANLPCSWELQAGSPLAGRAAGVVATLADPAAAAIAASLPVATVPPVVAVAAHVPGSQQGILMLLPPVGGHRVSAMPMLNVSWRSWAVTSAPICCTMEETKVGSSLPTSARRKLKNRAFDGDKASINAQSYFSDISTKYKAQEASPAPAINAVGRPVGRRPVGVATEAGAVGPATAAVHRSAHRTTHGAVRAPVVTTVGPRVACTTVGMSTTLAAARALWITRNL